MQAARRQNTGPQLVKAAVPALSVRGLRVAYGTEATGTRIVLDGVTFEVRDGEFLCVVGGSGTGKTTLLRALAGLVRPSGGELSFGGEPITGPSRDRANAQRV